MDGHLVKVTNALESHEEYWSIWVKNPGDYSAFEGYCWPGDSYWVDYFNIGGVKMWKSLYGYDSFQGSNSLFHIWIDMNEPSVFGGPEGTMEKDKIHSVGSSPHIYV